MPTGDSAWLLLDPNEVEPFRNLTTLTSLGTEAPYSLNGFQVVCSANLRISHHRTSTVSFHSSIDLVFRSQSVRLETVRLRPHTFVCR